MGAVRVAVGGVAEGFVGFGRADDFEGEVFSDIRDIVLVDNVEAEVFEFLFLFAVRGGIFAVEAVEDLPVGAGGEL